uniref:FMN hydroxy acid dehydrogenase domain-containing protein n=1 Tax=Panagrellus redivivus TaxID=6233 RepID=A0A7E4W0Q5_PANRE
MTNVAENLKHFVSVGDVETRALDLLPKAVKGYYASGADDENTLHRNRKAFASYLIRPKILVDVTTLNTKTSIRFDAKNVYNFDYPIGIAPSAFHCMAHPEGEIATARAAGETGTPMICSTLGTTRIEDIAASSPPGTTLWYQLYVYKDRRITEHLVKRAIAAGFRALVLTVDAPTMGRRRADERNGFELPSHLRMANFDSETLGRTFQGDTGKSGFGDYVKSMFDLSLTWDDLRWLVEFSQIPVIVKGVLRGCDAKKSIEYGAKGIIVSNHGGRQVDHAPSTIEALPEVVKAVNGAVPVFLDGGIRAGTDIYKAIALGADMVFIGRPALYGLTVGGSDGVKHVLNLLRTEFDYAMRLSCTPSINAIRATPNLVVHESYFAKL